MENVSPWLMLVVGIVIGWLLAWLFGRGGQRELTERASRLESDLNQRSAELNDCRSQSEGLRRQTGERIAALEADGQARSAEVESLKAELQARSAEVDSLTAELKASSAEIDALHTKVVDLGNLAVPAAAAAVTELGMRSSGATLDLAPLVDDFTQIKGVGPAFAARLSASGINRYADLAALDPNEVRNVLGVREWQKVDTNAFVSEAKTLALRPRQIQIGDDLQRVEGIGPNYAIRLRAAGITTFRQLADSDTTALSEIIGAPAWRRVNYDDWIAQARLAADGDTVGLKTLQDQLNRRQGDNLDLIQGIGDTSIMALHNAGIYTYADLAQSTPEQLRSTLTKAGVRGGNVDAWIAEAKQRAAGRRITRPGTRTRSVNAVEVRSCPQDLEEVFGVGRLYEQRLYAVGVGTFWELGMLPDEELSSILDVRDFQKVDLAGIKTDAMRLANETATMGHVWDGSEPDDFDGLEGIGPVLERRLYAAGICTYADLAASSEDTLERICHAPLFNRPNYGRWIEQARTQLA